MPGIAGEAAVWVAILVTALGFYLFKLAGLSVPAKLLAHPVAERVADLIPVALLAALIAVQTFAGRRELELDARLPALLVAVVLLVLRANFLVVVVGAAATAALLRWI